MHMFVIKSFIYILYYWRRFRISAVKILFLTNIGGETEALKRLDAYFADVQQVVRFDKPMTSPVRTLNVGEGTGASTTVTSPHSLVV